MAGPADKYRDRGLLVDSVQLARLRRALVRDKYAAGKATIYEIVDANSRLDEAEAALRAHIEVYGRFDEENAE